MSSVCSGSNELGEFVCIHIDKTIYSLISVMKVCYEISTSYYVHITNSETHPNVFNVFLYPKEGSKESPASSVCQSFLEQLFEQDMRQKIISETNGIREIIVRKAFSAATKRNEPMRADYQNDVQKIMIKRA